VTVVPLVMAAGEVMGDPNLTVPQLHHNPKAAMEHLQEVVVALEVTMPHMVVVVVEEEEEGEDTMLHKLVVVVVVVILSWDKLWPLD